MKQGEAAEGGEMQNPALWAWNMMAQASKDVMEQVSKGAAENPKPEASPKKRKKPGR